MTQTLPGYGFSSDRVQPADEAGDGGEILIRVDSELSIANAAELQPHFAAALESRRAIAVDLGAVTNCDAAGLQLLCSLRRTAARRGRRLRLAALSAAVRRTATALGLAAAELPGTEEESAPSGGNGDGGRGL